MRKAVQHLLPLTQPLNRQAVILLIQEKSCFLPVLYIHQIPDTIFHNLHLCVKGFSYKALISLHALLLPYLGVTAFIDPPNFNALLRQNLFQLFQNHWFPPVNTKSQRFDYQNVTEFINHDSRKEICLPKNHTAAGCICHCLSVFPGIANPHFNKVFIYLCVRFSCHHANSNFGTGIDKSLSHGISVKILHTNHVSVFIITLNFCNLIIVNPGAAGL